MKVYVLLHLRIVDHHFHPMKVREFEAIFETREAAEKVVMESFEGCETLIKECEVYK